MKDNNKKSSNTNNSNDFQSDFKKNDGFDKDDLSYKLKNNPKGEFLKKDNGFKPFNKENGNSFKPRFEGNDRDNRNKRNDDGGLKPFNRENGNSFKPRFEGNDRDNRNKRNDDGGFKPFNRENGNSFKPRFEGNDRDNRNNRNDDGGFKPFNRENGNSFKPRFEGNDRDNRNNRNDDGGFKPFNRENGNSFKPKFEGNDRFNDNDNGRRKEHFKLDDEKPRRESKSNYKPKYDPEVKTNNKGFKPFDSKSSFKQKSDRKRLPKSSNLPLENGEIRLNKHIAQSGICSRREADELIKKGVVTVNGKVIMEMGFKVKPEDKVQYEGKTILAEPFVYILMNKPKDFITSTDDEKDRKTVIDLLTDRVQERVFPVGRLDRNTTGVLLITNDGELTQILTHPSFNIKKIYHAVLDKKMTAKDLEKMVEGFELEDGFVNADAVAFVESEDKRHVGIEIHSGKNHIVKRMFEHLGYMVEKLDRVSFGSFTKKDLPRGKWRHITNYELASIMKMKEKNS